MIAIPRPTSQDPAAEPTLRRSPAAAGAAGAAKSEETEGKLVCVSPGCIENESKRKIKISDFEKLNEGNSSCLYDCLKIASTQAVCPNMESEGKGGEDEESLQMAFKKLKVDSERAAPAAVRINTETTTSRTSMRGSPDGAKPRTACSSKESWHGSTRKPPRGAIRTQRRRRSKSPILHPPKFTYCSSAAPAASCQVKHSSQTEAYQGLAMQPPKECCKAGQSEAVFGAKVPTVFSLESSEESAGGSSAESRSNSPPESPKAAAAAAALEPSQAPKPTSDFQSLSKLHQADPCRCSRKEKECRCKRWQDVEVYSFTGLRTVISECERDAAEASGNTPPRRRTQTGSGGASGSPRSCSEEARTFVEDITIEDLSGYMEYYLYIPKKMSHMAEMMYT
ncbi:oxidative stress-responsive serine-rich protein 1 [Heptranchias perlo]|uniref:oxidative stress-responsive serine-rich protein 1 n=1 Tax=Heptranchias perlo TaxID=212740 RepID=UPI0035594DD0